MDPGLKAEKVVEDVQGRLILAFAFAAAIWFSEETEHGPDEKI
jgi:hypothetical protein